MSELYPNELPLTSWVLVDAEGVIVHSRYVEERVRETGYPGPVWRIPMASWPSVPHGAPPGLPTGRFPVIGCFGFLNSTKRIPQLLEGFAIVRQRVPDALLVLAGGLAPGLDLEQHLELLGLKRGVDVICLDRVSEHRLWGLIRACDVCVALRAPTMGETSAMAVRILAAGRPLVTSNLGWFAELPDEVTAKIPVDEQEVDVLAATLERLARQPELRKRMGAAALEHVRREHGLDDVAELYAAALGELRAG
jgi:glycosyltransferase involved in cell wall biosynthesis